MPELPEVETIRRGLSKAMTGQLINEVIVRRTDLRRPLPDGFVETVRGKNIVTIGRRAKYLLMRLENDVVVLIHLGMSGRMVIELGTDPHIPNRKHEHIVFVLENDNIIRFSDPRRFGLMELSHAKNLSSHQLLKDIGPEPLSIEFNGLTLANRLQGRKTPIKSVLLDQRVVAGLGNIYVCEGLFMAGLSPMRSANTITLKQASILVKKTKELLLDAIESGGSTLKDHVSATGEMGYFQHKFKVYGRAGHPCPICEEPVRRIVQAGRSTFFCSECQG
ncbi:MAG: bifunctional DNA-formamidopyrimidine glycosylase/DNA-(apurinic or apyrimidinic site) lyase [Pseudomonadota bacterium]|nr:bifunctional DNA-formamidopyrimidine glycosylase/DNA-(apurinic or apyrimidinic site) lyase [Pseudomonadota bacterium]